MFFALKFWVAGAFNNSVQVWRTTEAAFIQAFRALLRAKNVLESYADFSWAALGIDEETFIDYQTKYIDLYAKVKRENAKQKTSILNDIDLTCLAMMCSCVANAELIEKFIDENLPKISDADSIQKEFEQYGKTRKYWPSPNSVTMKA